MRNGGPGERRLHAQEEDRREGRRRDESLEAYIILAIEAPDCVLSLAARKP